MNVTYSCTDGKMATQAHAGCADEACASWEAEKMVDGGIGVGIIRLKSLRLS